MSMLKMVIFNLICKIEVGKNCKYNRFFYGNCYIVFLYEFRVVLRFGEGCSLLIIKSSKFFIEIIYICV